jgi:hypothetical protein
MSVAREVSPLAFGLCPHRVVFFSGPGIRLMTSTATGRTPIVISEEEKGAYYEIEYLTRFRDVGDETEKMGLYWEDEKVKKDVLELIGLVNLNLKVYVYNKSEDFSSAFDYWTDIQETVTIHPDTRFYSAGDMLVHRLSDSLTWRDWSEVKEPWQDLLEVVAKRHPKLSAFFVQKLKADAASSAKWREKVKEKTEQKLRVATEIVAKREELLYKATGQYLSGKGFGRAALEWVSHPKREGLMKRRFEEAMEDVTDKMSDIPPKHMKLFGGAIHRKGPK